MVCSITDRIQHEVAAVIIVGSCRWREVRLLQADLPQMPAGLRGGPGAMAREGEVQDDADTGGMQL
jgi:hypothetical protein